MLPKEKSLKALKWLHGKLKSVGIPSDQLQTCKTWIKLKISKLYKPPPGTIWKQKCQNKTWLLK